ncbi:hypothetical protein K1719_002686 [Acacia pycnantha]|nr:hypothetical protein K1719_002686 [Acacia pycnantha]
MASPILQLSPLSSPKSITILPRNSGPSLIQGYAMKTHIKDDISVLTKLINFCTSNPTTASLGYAHKMFDGISNPDIVLFNTMERGYARFENPLQAIVLLAQLLSSGLVPDDYTFSTLLKACGRVKASEEGKQVHCLAIKLGVNDNVQPNEALALFRELQERGLKPTDVTMLVALSSCALLGALDLGKWIHEYIKKNGFDQYVKVNTALIDMYAKCGSLDDAVSVFENMPVRDTQAWSSMIVAYATHGHGFKALSMLEEMDKVKV